MQHQAVTDHEQSHAEPCSQDEPSVQDLHEVPAWRVLRFQAIFTLVAAVVLLLVEVWLVIPRASQEVAVFLRRPRSISSAELTSILNGKSFKSWGYVALPTLPATDLTLETRNSSKSQPD